jgi:hypothetical protein
MQEGNPKISISQLFAAAWKTVKNQTFENGWTETLGNSSYCLAVARERLWWSYISDDKREENNLWGYYSW